ncbi:MAG: hypothetical protein AAF750_10845 [Planctomycetota bacterium]
MSNPNKSASATFGLTVIACVAILAMDIYPGFLGDLIFPVALIVIFLVLPAATLVALIALVARAARGKLQRGQDILRFRMPWRRLAVIGIMLAFTCSLIYFNVPRHLAFRFAQSAFEQMVPQAQASDYGGHPLHQGFGPYYVDEFAADPRGGVYFRTRRGSDGIGPDTMSHGFVKHPNPNGTPFGAARYRLFPIGNGWHQFQASNDWH